MPGTLPLDARVWTSNSENLGRRARVIDRDEIIILLKAAVERAGTQEAFAARHGFHPSYISMLLRGKCGPGPVLINALGLRTVYELLE